MHLIKKKENWVILARDNRSPLLRNAIWTYAFANWSNWTDLPNLDLGVISRNNDIDYIGLMSTWNKNCKVLFAKAKKDLAVIDKAIENSFSNGIEMNKFTASIYEKDLSKCTAKQLVSYYTKFGEFQSKQYMFGALLPLIEMEDAFVESTVRKFLESKLSKKKATEYYGVLTYPEHDSEGQKGELALLKLYSGIIKDKDTKQKLKQETPLGFVSYLKKSKPSLYADMEKHSRQHSWEFYVFMGPGYKSENFVLLLQDYLVRNIDPEVELKRLSERRKFIDKGKKRIIAQLKPDAWTKRMLLLIGRIVWAKPRRKDYQFQSYFHIEKLQKEVGKRLNIPLDLVKSASIDIIRDMLLKKQPVDIEFLRSLLQLHVVYPSKGKVVLLYGKEAEKFIKDQVKSSGDAKNLKKNELTGSCACAGKVKGIVRIINSIEDMSKMEYGDILVAWATNPAIVPAMKKAAAIVTNEGGLTCHAAIVSRELNIPCIVGTKIATEVLKDGDIVEVDADNGIVKKK